MSQPASHKRKRQDSHSQSKRRKLAPSRPFPIVPTSVSATGPRSAHKEGKNQVCVTRKTTLGAYMSRCKSLVVSDGYKTLVLCAMGAAIPHLAQLALALPPILPHDDISTEIVTGSQDVHDEIDEEDADVTYESRCKSTLTIILRIDGGDDHPKDVVVVTEPEQQMEMD